MLNDKELASLAAKLERISRLSEEKRQAFRIDAPGSWIFENDDGADPAMSRRMRKYAESWDIVKKNDLGLLLWGDVGTGKSFFAACIANALMEKGVSVRMVTLGRVMNALGSGYGDQRTECLDDLASCGLLILDDFGSERATGYAMEQLFLLVDGRVRSHLPMIVTTNLSLSELKHPEDLTRMRIYDRVLGVCAPIRFTGKSRRPGQGEEKLALARKIMDS